MYYRPIRPKSSANSPWCRFCVLYLDVHPMYTHALHAMHGMQQSCIHHQYMGQKWKKSDLMSNRSCLDQENVSVAAGAQAATNVPVLRAQLAYYR